MLHYLHNLGRVLKCTLRSYLPNIVQGSMHLFSLLARIDLVLYKSILYRVEKVNLTTKQMTSTTWFKGIVSI